MSVRAYVQEAMSAAFDFARVTASSIGSRSNSVLATIQANTNPESSESEQIPAQALWGHAAILYRPAAATSEGSLEVFIQRRGEDFVPVASRDLRWQIAIDEGDVVLRNFSASAPVRVRLNANGTMILEANEVRIGDAGATHTVGLGDVIKAHFDSIRATFNDHRHGPGNFVAPSGGGPVTGLSEIPGTGVLGAIPTPFAATPNIESRHKVEL
jgi:hypothetical protein